MVDLPALFAAWKGVQGDSGINFSHTENGSSWVPQQPVSGVGTSHTPSLTYFHTRLTSSHIDGLFMAWKGARDDSGIYWSHTDDGASWAPQQRVQDAGTNRGPSLAVFNGRLFMAWKGVGDDSGIYWSHTDRGLAPQDWAAQHRVPDVGTSEAPSLAVFNDRLFMVWKGVGDDSGIYWSSTLDGASWAPQQRVPGVGTSDGPSLAAFFGFYTAGQLVMAWKGVDDDQGIYRSFTFDGDFWAPQHRFIDVGTSKGPRLSSLGTFGPFRQGRLWMAWKGARDDSGIYWSHTDEAAFADWIPQQGPVPQAGTSEGAALAFFAPVASRTPFLDGMEVPSRSKT
jgi:hypothetical protein